MHNSIYEANEIKNLFGEMSKTYGKVNLVTSFGFSVRWRRQCVEQAQIKTGHIVYDLMTGMGECLPYISKHAGPDADLTAIDFCHEMYVKAVDTAQRLKRNKAVNVVEADVLDLNILDGSIDRIICSFGLKTLSDEGLRKLADLTYKLLKPDGRFSFVEISEPESKLLRASYVPYIRHIIPFFGSLFLGNPDNYRMLGEYTRQFGNCQHVVPIFEAAGFEVNYYSLFFGCASGISGQKLDD